MNLEWLDYMKFIYPQNDDIFFQFFIDLKNRSLTYSHQDKNLVTFFPLDSYYVILPSSDLSFTIINQNTQWILQCVDKPSKGRIVVKLANIRKKAKFADDQKLFIENEDNFYREFILSELLDCVKFKLNWPIRQNISAEFENFHRYSSEDNKHTLQNRLQKSFLLKSHRKYTKPQNNNLLFVTWDKLLEKLNSVQFFDDNAAKSAIRSGVPDDYRGLLWKRLVHLKLAFFNRGISHMCYLGFMKEIEQGLAPTEAISQINKDIYRTTMPGNLAVNFDSLRNVLYIFSLYKKSNGYCQGVNFIAAFLLQILGEEETFFTLVLLVDKILPPDYFGDKLFNILANQKVLTEIFADKCPTLFKHLKKFEISFCEFTTRWFLTLFTGSFSAGIVFRIWDSLLFEGEKIIFRFAVAFLKYNEDTILGLKSALEMRMFLQSMDSLEYDVDKLLSIAFNLINPFPGNRIVSRRNFYLEKLAKGERIGEF